MEPRPTVDGYSTQDTARLHADAPEPDERSPFARDCDRLLYTPDFRRLQGKSQVAMAGEADFFRTRLTHTLEVAQVARRITEVINRRAAAARSAAGTARRIDDAAEVARLPAEQQMLDPDLVEAAAIVHDLGHTPFGHVGESALNDALLKSSYSRELDEIEGFNANAQSFRLVTTVMSHHGEERGAQLTMATLDAALKYPWVPGEPGAGKKSSWSVNATEKKDFDAVRAAAPANLRNALTVEAQIMDWADDVAYSVHDLDDWTRAGYIPLARLATDATEQERVANFMRGRGERFEEARVLEVLAGPESPLRAFREFADEDSHVYDVTSGATKRAIRRLRSRIFGLAMEHWTLERRPGTEEFDCPRRYLFEFTPDDDVRFAVDVLKELLWLYVVEDSRVATLQHGHRNVITGLFEIYDRCVAEDELRLFRDERRRFMRELGFLEQLRAVIDHICSMTDAEAIERFEQLRTGSAPFHGYP